MRHLDLADNLVQLAAILARAVRRQLAKSAGGRQVAHTDWRFTREVPP
jgi:hypothetical protein